MNGIETENLSDEDEDDDKNEDDDEEDMLKRDIVSNILVNVYKTHYHYLQSMITLSSTAAGGQQKVHCISGRTNDLYLFLDRSAFPLQQTQGNDLDETKRTSQNNNLFQSLWNGTRNSIQNNFRLFVPQDQAMVSPKVFHHLLRQYDTYYQTNLINLLQSPSDSSSSTVLSLTSLPTSLDSNSLIVMDVDNLNNKLFPTKMSLFNNSISDQYSRVRSESNADEESSKIMVNGHETKTTERSIARKLGKLKTLSYAE